jgi:uncharacterized protein YndB with AHSA1/START domain
MTLIIFTIVFYTYLHLIYEFHPLFEERAMFMYSASIDIAATPSQVFAILTDPTAFTQWTPEVVEVQSPEGGVRVGAIGCAVVEELGQRFTAQMVVVVLEPDTRLAYDMTTPRWSGRIEYVLTSRGAGTTLSFHVIPAGPKPNRVVQVIGRLTRPLVERKLRSRLKALRRIVVKSQCTTRL